MKDYRETMTDDNTPLCNKLYTKDEVIRLLEDLYEEVAESYNDYFRTDFSVVSQQFVKEYLIRKGY